LKSGMKRDLVSDGGSSFWPVVIKTFLVTALVTPTS
jgi:hypothetical protein